MNIEIEKQKTCKKIKCDLIKRLKRGGVKIVPDFSNPFMFRVFFKKYSPIVIINISSDCYDLGDFGVSDDFVVASYYFETVHVCAEPDDTGSVNRAIKELRKFHRDCDLLKPILEEIVNA